MGRHASAERRRSVAAWPVVVGVVVLLLTVATVFYFRVVNHKNDTAGCSGSTLLPVVVGPAAAQAVRQAAQDFNATGPVARSTCVSVAVTAMAGPATVAALTGGWQGQRTAPPGLWIADSAADVAAMDAANSAMTAGHPAQGLATSPVVLAVRRAAAPSVSWASLAAGSGGLVVGIGDPATDRASAAALQSLVHAASGPPAGTAGITSAAIAGAGPLFGRLAPGSSTVPATTELALTALAAGSSSYTAVPVLESDLAAFDVASGASLVAVHPSGPTAGVQVMPVPLTAPWVSNAMSDAAAAFDGYLNDAPGTAVFTAAHLRTANAPLASGGVDLRAPVTALPDGAPATITALTTAWKAATSDANVAAPPALSTAATTVQPGGGNSTPSAVPPGGTAALTPPATTASGATVSAAPTPATTTSVASASRTAAAGPAITFMVDTSSSMGTLTGGARRLTWVKSAVSSVVQKLPTNSYGLWRFDTSSAEPVPLGRLDEPVGSTPRSTAIVAALNGLTPDGDSHTYGAIRTVFTDAANATAPGQVHRVILLTDGFDSTPGLSRNSIKATVAGLVALHPGLGLDIVGLSTGVNEQALTEIAAAGGGTFTPVNTLADLQPTLLALSSGSGPSR